MPSENDVASATRKAVAKAVIFLVLIAAVLIGISGDPGWIAAWLFTLVFFFLQMLAFVEMRRQPDLIVERSKIQSGTKEWDKIIVALIAVLLPIATWVVAALDRRYHWTPPGHPGWIALGFVLMLIGGFIMRAAIAANRFFSATVRIQENRGHSVVSHGPYAHVRHPGYAGMLVFTVGMGLVLGSNAAWIPAGANMATLVLRTTLEDRTLHAELAGYADYAQRVRSRLAPMIW